MLPILQVVFDARCLVCLLLIAGLVGCGDGRPSRSPVSGLIKIDGAPLKEGSIGFKPVAGGRAARGRIEAGRYTVTTYTKGDGLPDGEYFVTVEAFEALSETKVRWLAPKRYSVRKTADLRATIKEETDSLDFDLTWKDSGSGHDAPWVESLN